MRQTLALDRQLRPSHSSLHSLYRIGLAKHGSSPIKQPVRWGSDMQMVIVGAGFAGLAAARCLQAAGVSFTLFEAEDGPGGLLRTDTVGNFAFDRAGHFLHFRTESFRRVLEDLQVPMTDVIRKSAVLMSGRTIPYPLQFNLHAAEAGLRNAVLADLAAGRIGKLDVRDYATSLGSAWGPTLYDAFFAPYNEKLWARPLRDLPVDCGARFLPQPDEALMLAGAVNPVTRYGYNADFVYPSSGRVGDLAEAMAKPLAHVIHFNTVVDAVDLDARRVRAAGRWVPYSQLIFTGSLSSMVKMTGIVSPDLCYSRVLNLRVGFRGSMLNDAHWLYIPDPAARFFRVGFPANVDFRTCPDGHASLSLEYGLTETQAVPDLSQLAAEAVDYLSRAGIIQCDAVEETAAHMISPAYVAQRNVDRPAFTATNDRLIEAKVRMAGRFGTWDYFSAEDAYLDGSRAAASALCERSQ